MQNAECRTKTRTADYADFTDSAKAAMQSARPAMLSSELSLFPRVILTRCKRSFSTAHRSPYRKLLDHKPPPGGVPCPGSGGRWGRNQRHGESESRFRPQQILLARAAVLTLRAGVPGAASPGVCDFDFRNQTRAKTPQPTSCRDRNISFSLIAAMPR
jgi:hypothetical protein